MIRLSTERRNRFHLWLFGGCFFFLAVLYRNESKKESEMTQMWYVIAILFRMAFCKAINKWKCMVFDLVRHPVPIMPDLIFSLFFLEEWNECVCKLILTLHIHFEHKYCCSRIIDTIVFWLFLSFRKNYFESTGYTGKTTNKKINSRIFRFRLSRQSEIACVSLRRRIWFLLSSNVFCSHLELMQYSTHVMSDLFQLPARIIFNTYETKSSKKKKEKKWRRRNI